MKRSSLWWSIVLLGACGPALTGRAVGTTLQICRTEDPIPNAVDDERSLCLSVNLVALEAGSYTVDGTAALTDSTDSTTLVFTPGSSNASKLTSAMASASCFASPNNGPSSQQLKGTLRIDRVGATAVDGSVNVALSGALPGPTCGFSVPTTLLGAFQLTR